MYEEKERKFERKLEKETSVTVEGRKLKKREALREDGKEECNLNFLVVNFKRYYIELSSFKRLRSKSEKSSIYRY